MADLGVREGGRAGKEKVGTEGEGEGEGQGQRMGDREEPRMREGEGEGQGQGQRMGD